MAELDKDDKFNAADFGVFIVCELFAVPLCHAGWDNIVSGDHPYRGIAALAFGVPIGLIGASFHWWKNRLPSTSRWMTRQADRWWPVALLVLFVWVAGPVLYQRTFPGIEVPAPMGRISWDMDQNASGRGFFLNISKTGDAETRFLGFQAHGKNNSGDPITEFSGLMRSALTNVPRPIYIMAEDIDETSAHACSLPIPTLPENTYGIPPFAEFNIATFDKPFINYGVDGVPMSKFMSDYGAFTVVLNYDGTKYEKSFSKEQIQMQQALLEKTAILQSVPHVVRKATAPKVTLPPLQLPLATPRPAQEPPTGSVPPKD